MNPQNDSAKTEAPLPTVYELVPVLLREIKAGVQKWGVSKELQHFQEAMAADLKSGENLPPWAMDIYLIAIHFAVRDILREEGCAMPVTYGLDPSGPWVCAADIGGAYAEWHADPSFNVQQNWNCKLLIQSE